MVFILALKVSFPSKVTLLRGIHECRAMTDFFTFREEAINKFDADIYDIFCDLFDNMPISATVNNDYLCLHGGLSPDLEDLEQINPLHRV